VAIPIFQSSRFERHRSVRQGVRATNAGAEKEFPARAWTTASSTTPRCSFRDSIRAGDSHVCFEAVLLVVIVVVLFLQTWRALDHSPDRGTGFHRGHVRHHARAWAYRLTRCPLFGLVLAIGIVVDDAIVVVENVERNIELGLSPREAYLQGDEGK